MAKSGRSASRRTHPVSIADVALHAGVSVGTVSHVLNHPERVARKTRARIEAAMSELGFVPNDLARQLRAGTSRVLAYVMLDASNPFFTDVARGIDSHIESAGLNLILCDSRESAERELSFLNLLEQQRVQGVLITPVDTYNSGLKALTSRGTPVVVVDRTTGSHASCEVGVDDLLGGRLAIEHLLELGHRRIAFIGGPWSLRQVQDRHDGAAAALREAGDAASELVVMRTESLTVASGRDAGERLSGLPIGRRPTAAFCANDLLALGLLQHCVSSGRTVPDDLNIVGYDDIDFAAAAAVPLTSVRQPRHLLGRRAAELLLDEATNPEHEHVNQLFTPELIVRRSTSRAR